MQMRSDISVWILKTLMIELIWEMESELDHKVITFDWIMEIQILIFDWMSGMLGQMSTYVWFTKISI